MTSGLENYQDFAKRYADTIDQHHIRLYYDRPAMLPLIPPVQGKRVLDAGCGSGSYTEWLLDQGAAVTAFDITPEFVEITRQRTSGHATVHQGDLSQPLSFARDQHFDVVISSLVLHYVENLAATFKEIHRVLVPGGQFIFSTLHPMTDAPPTLNYFETAMHEMIWTNFGEPYPIIKVYHRPLMAILNPLSEAGFRLDKFVEPQPLPEMEAIAPEEYRALKQKPIFIFVRGVKV